MQVHHVHIYKSNTLGLLPVSSKVNRSTSLLLDQPGVQIFPAELLGVQEQLASELAALNASGRLALAYVLGPSCGTVVG